MVDHSFGDRFCALVYAIHMPTPDPSPRGAVELCTTGPCFVRSCNPRDLSKHHDFHHRPKEVAVIKRSKPLPLILKPPNNTPEPLTEPEAPKPPQTP